MISGNNGSGVQIAGGSPGEITTCEGNFIGTKANGVDALSAIAAAGVQMDSSQQLPSADCTLGDA